MLGSSQEWCALASHDGLFGSEFWNVLRRLHIDGYVLALLAMAVLGAILPVSGDVAAVFRWLIKGAIAFLFLLYGARLSPVEAWAGVKHWRLHLTLLAFTYVVFPVFGVVLGLITRGFLPDELRIGLVFLCLIPSTVQSSIAYTSLARGNVAGAVVGASLSNVIGVVLTPLLVVAILTTSGSVSVGAESLISIVTQLLVPFLIGQLVRPLVAELLAAHSAVLKLVDRGAIMLVVYAAFSAGTVAGIWSSVSVSKLGVVLGLCVALLCSVLAACSVAGRVFGFGDEDRVVIVCVGSMKSLASGLPMATVFFGGQTALIILPLMMFHQLQLMVCAVLAQRWSRRSQQEMSGAAVAPDIS